MKDQKKKKKGKCQKPWFETETTVYIMIENSGNAGQERRRRLTFKLSLPKEEGLDTICSWAAKRNLAGSSSG